MRKNYFLLIDTETTQAQNVADFGAIVCDKKGNIVAQCAVLVSGIFGKEPLFFDSNAQEDALWSAKAADQRETKYKEMLADGMRMLASVPAINSWLLKAYSQFKPVLTAYNLAFDLDKCSKTGIDLTMFTRKFCLWHCAFNAIGQSKAYKRFVLDNHLFNAPTERGNMTYKVNAETVSAFISGQYDVEPHTAYEDVVLHELPILQHLLKRKSVKQLQEVPPYNWRLAQVRDNFNV
jgi:hypothetical protein